MRLSWEGVRILRYFADHPAIPRYGLEVFEALNISSGTGYPILYRFEKEGLLRGSWEKANERKLQRRLRNYYRITTAGMKFVKTLK